MSQTTETGVKVPNVGINSDAFVEGMRRGVLLPSIPGLDSGMMKSLTANVDNYVAGWNEVYKSMLSTPPSALPYDKISFLPDPARTGIIQPPGLQMESIQKICRENIAPQMIIQMRVLDVLRYAQHANHQWRPGWTVVLRDGRKHPTDRDLQEIRRCERFLINCNMETAYDEARVRDASRLTNFHNFLARCTRDSLRYDAIGVWTNMDVMGRVREFASLPGGNVRLCGKYGYMNQPDKFAVLVDDTGNPQEAFTRQQLTYVTRNPRNDPGVEGYGYSEIEMGVRLIQGFQNALDLNISTFDKNGIPNGMLKLMGDAWSDKPMDALARMWVNMKKGITKYWALPAINVPENSDIELLNFMDLKDTDVRYKDHMNMVAGVFCTIYGFPVRRLGYHISGSHRDNEPIQDGSTDIVGDDDPGLSPLLSCLESMINEYLVWSQFPHLQFLFTAKSPKEDARAYEARRNSMTWREARAENDLKPLEEEFPENKEIALLMNMTPIDSNLAAVYQTVVSAHLQAKAKEKEQADSQEHERGMAEDGLTGPAAKMGPGGKAPTPGARTGEKKDPAASEAHGKLSGVRRDSAKEKGKVTA